MDIFEEVSRFPTCQRTRKLILPPYGGELGGASLLSVRYFAGVCIFSQTSVRRTFPRSVGTVPVVNQYFHVLSVFRVELRFICSLACFFSFECLFGGSQVIVATVVPTAYSDIINRHSVLFHDSYLVGIGMACIPNNLL